MHISLIGAAIGCGAQKAQTEQGPFYLKEWKLAEHLQEQGLDATWDTIITTASEGTPLARVQDLSQNLARTVAKACQPGQIPVTLGGDHSMAIGTWAGVTDGYSKQQALGLIWIDAHMDAHTFETTPSKAIHGMPVAVLLGAGESTLVNAHQPGAKLKPEHLVMIGIRSFESGEAEFLRTQGVRIFYMEEVKERGFEVVFREALSIITQATAAFGLTIDLDAFDPEDAPGVGSPEGYGLRKQEVLPHLHLIGKHPQFCALEIAEYNPAFDRDNQTAQLVQDLIIGVFS